MWHMNLVAAGVKICMTGISSQVTVLSYNFYFRSTHDAIIIKKLYMLNFYSIVLHWKPDTLKNGTFLSIPETSKLAVLL